MENKIREAFDTVEASPALKNQTKTFLAKRLYRTKAWKGSLLRATLAAACLIALLFGGGFYVYLEPVSAISIDVNPSIELGINRFDRVVSVSGYNEDGQRLASFLDVKYLSYTEAVAAIISGEQLAQYLAEGEVMAVTVAAPSVQRNEEMVAALSPYTAEKNISCHSVNTGEAEDAHAHGLSLGKYSAYLTLARLDPSITADQVKDLSMREIRDWIEELSGSEEVPGLGGNGQGNGNGQGSGHGKGGGRGHGGHGWRSGRN